MGDPTAVHITPVVEVKIIPNYEWVMFGLFEVEMVPELTG